MLQLSEIYIYPIKSLGGIAVKEARVTATGLEYDRRWMLVDENNHFISQREVPQMALLQVSIEAGGLLITHKITRSSITIPFGTSNPVERKSVIIWDDTCIAEFVCAKADEWFTGALGINCRLVYMPEDCKRAAEQIYAPPEALNSFSDAYPFLIIGQASLDDLNCRLTETLPMERFRPNLVFTGGRPYEEDMMANFTIRDINFFGVKLCARCVIPTIDQNTSTKSKEPLKTLASYRNKNNKIYFGQNLVHKGDGMITVGDILQTVSTNHEERFIMKTPAEKTLSVGKTFGNIVNEVD